MKTRPSLIFLALLALPVATASAQLIAYTDRSQANLLNAYNASMSITGDSAGYDLTSDQARYFVESINGSVGFGRANVLANPPVATIDLGGVRNIKTLNTMFQTYANYGFSAATVETSNDGTTWTTRSNTVTTLTNTTGGTAYTNVVTLNTAVNARYVRLTPTTYQLGGGADARWLFNTMRVFGDTGTMAGDANLSIVANGGFSAAQSLVAVGTTAFLNPAQMIAPATSPVNWRQVMYNMGNSSGFKLDLGQTFSVDAGTLEVTNFLASGSQPLVMTLSGSTDGTTFNPLYSKTYTANINGSNFDLFNYSFSQTNARYLEVTFSTAMGANTDIRVSDFAFFQGSPVPEPQTWALAALGASVVLFRLRRKQRAA